MTTERGKETIHLDASDGERAWLAWDTDVRHDVMRIPSYCCRGESGEPCDNTVAPMFPIAFQYSRDGTQVRLNYQCTQCAYPWVERSSLDRALRLATHWLMGETMEVAMHEPIVKFFKGTNNGAMATATTATDPDEFLRACAEEFPTALRARLGDEEFTCGELLPQICLIWAKLNGYKADTVFEQRRLVVGEPSPEKCTWNA
jgi:hypothetical protein